MLVPSFAPDIPVEITGDDKGEWTAAWRILLTNLLIEMQRTLSNEGFVPPSLAASDIALLNAENGTLVYDSDNNVLKVNINGTFKTVLTS